MFELRFDPEEMKARGYDPRTIEEARRSHEAHDAALQLIGEIEIAFRGMPRPKITLSVARGYDDEWNLSEERVQELAARDSETDWQDVSRGAAESHQEYFTFSDAEGCRFYLPAYMRFYLEDFPYNGFDAVYWACTQPDKLRALNEEQLACVAKFLALCHRYQTEFRSGDGS